MPPGLPCDWSSCTLATNPVAECFHCAWLQKNYEWFNLLLLWKLFDTSLWHIEEMMAPTSITKMKFCLNILIVRWNTVFIISAYALLPPINFIFNLKYVALLTAHENWVTLWLPIMCRAWYWIPKTTNWHYERVSTEPLSATPMLKHGISFLWKQPRITFSSGE